ncbi:MAG: hypothetical protein ACREFO_20675 [Acetobacteraceae bacterium]
MPLGWLAAAALAIAPPAPAAPSLTRAQVYALFAAPGFPVGRDKHPVNRCGEKANPKVTLVDMNGDHRPEALFIVRWNGVACKIIGCNDGDQPCTPMRQELGGRIRPSFRPT